MGSYSKALRGRLQAALDVVGMSAYAVDKKAKEWGSGYVSKLLRDEIDSPPADRLIKIADILGVRAAWLVCAEGPMFREEEELDPLDAAVAWLEGRVTDEAVAKVRAWAANHPRPGWKPAAWGRFLVEVQRRLLDEEAFEITDEFEQRMVG